MAYITQALTLYRRKQQLQPVEHQIDPETDFEFIGKLTSGLRNTAVSDQIARKQPRSITAFRDELNNEIQIQIHFINISCIFPYYILAQP